VAVGGVQAGDDAAAEGFAQLGDVVPSCPANTPYRDQSCAEMN
jgi:hypothetical protein